MVYKGHVRIRRTIESDVPEIVDLIRRYSFREDGSGFLIPVSEEGIYGILYSENRGALFTAFDYSREVVAGCVSLVVYGMPYSHENLIEELTRRSPKYGPPSRFRELRTANNREIAELRSLAAHPEYRGLGLPLIDTVVEEARKRALDQLYSLIHEGVQNLFVERAGFRVLDDPPPEKLLTDCLNCSRLQNCTEMTVVKDLAA